MEKERLDIQQIIDIASTNRGGSYTYSNKICLDPLFFDYNFPNSVFKFENCEFKEQIIFNGGNAGHIHFFNCSFEYVSFLNCNFKSELILQNISAKKITFAGGNFKRVSITVETINELSIIGGLFVNSFNLTGSALKKDSKPNIDSLLIDTENRERVGEAINGNFIFRNLEIHEVVLTGDTNGCKFLFQSLNTSKIFFIEFINSGSTEFSILTFLSGSKPKHFEILSSNLKGVRFTDANLSYSETTIYQSDVTEVVTNNVIWPKHINKNKHLSTQREVYRQLKANALKQNDIISFLSFQEKEMDSYYQYLKNTKSNFQDRFILWTNKISNDHGRSWSRAFLWIIFFAVLSFLLLSCTTFCPSDEVKNNWAKGFYMLNPTHKLNEVFSSYQYENTAIVIDSISKILIGYLLFQMFRAFRKFIR